MAGKLKKLVLVALATVGMTVGATGGTAWAIDNVPCDNDEFVNVEAHFRFAGEFNACFANAGTFAFFDRYAEGIWVTKIWTGNNRVQWFGDQRWQPEHSSIDKNTVMTWPNHPGGVKIERVRIL